MDSFDDFLRNELTRIKLDEYDTVARMKLAAQHKIADAAGKHDPHMRGVANLKAMIQKLVGGFKTYCGEQEIDYRDARLEDFIEFVRVSFGVSEENFDKLAYGAHAGKSAHQDELNQATQRLNKAMHDNDSISAAMLQSFEDIAEKDKASEMAVRKVLWQLYRRYPSRANVLNALRDYIGFDLSAQKLYQTATAVAKVLLTKARSQPLYSDEEGKKEEDKSGLDPKKLDDGEVDGPNNRDLAKKYRSDAFTNLSNLMGLSLSKFQKAGHDIAQGIADGDQSVQRAITDRFDRAYTKEECIRFTRLMLEFFNTPDKVDSLKPLFDLADATTRPRLEAAVNESLRIIRAGASSGKYDGTKVNQLLVRITNRENTAAKLCVIMIYCTHSILA